MDPTLEGDIVLTPDSPHEGSRVKEIGNFLADFDEAFAKEGKFDSSLHGQDDPNTVYTRVRMYSQTARSHPYRTPRTLPSPVRRSVNPNASRATQGAGTREPRVDVGGFCDRLINTKLVHLAIRTRRLSTCVQMSSLRSTSRRKYQQFATAGENATMHIQKPDHGTHEDR